MGRLKRYNQIGWTCIFYALLFFPLNNTINSLNNYFFEDLYSRSFSFVLNVILAFMEFYILLSFKEFINLKFRYYDVNKFIDIYILCMMGNSLLYFIVPNEFGIALAGILGIAAAVFQIIYSVKLLGIKENKIVIVTVLMLINGISMFGLTGIDLSQYLIFIYNIILSVIFFEASKQHS